MSEREFQKKLKAKKVSFTQVLPPDIISGKTLLRERKNVDGIMCRAYTINQIMDSQDDVITNVDPDEEEAFLLEEGELKEPLPKLVEYSDSDSEEEENCCEVGIFKNTDFAKTPRKATPCSAGLDLCADKRLYTTLPWILKPGQWCDIYTGLRIVIPHDYVGKIYSRSGMAKDGLIVKGGPLIVDSDFIGILAVPMMNISSRPIKIHTGERFAQMTIEKVTNVKLYEIDDEKKIKDTVRGWGAFGSTGK